MEQGFRYEKDCLSKKERTTCIGNGNSGENLKQFNVKRMRKTAYKEKGAAIYDALNIFIFALALKQTKSELTHFLRSSKPPRAKRQIVAATATLYTIGNSQ